MANKRMLNKSKLEEFKKHLDDHGIGYRPGKGPYQVLQVLTKKGFKCIFTKDSMPDHYTIQDELVPIVDRFLEISREKSNG